MSKENNVTPLVEIKDLSIAFGGIKAVDHASVDLYPGEVVAILGHNGAGKSTLIKIVSGAYKRDSGQIFVEGKEADINNQTVGIGGRPDRDGNVTLDACIMDKDGNCGAVLCMQNIASPVSVARKVMEETPHVMLAGKGAEKFAYELLVYNNQTPFTLEMLARIYIVKQNHQTAEIFLNALEKQPFHKEYAQAILTDLHAGSYTDIVTPDSVVDFDTIDFIFKSNDFYARLIDKNPKNKMAFEYMMAFFLLTKQLDNFAVFRMMMCC